MLDSGTDCQDELSSPDGSPMVISPIVGQLPSQGEDDINLSLIMAEFANRPALLSPIDDQYQPLKVPADLLVARKVGEISIAASGDSGTSVVEGHSIRERAYAPDVSLEGPFNIHRVRHHPATPLRSLPEGQDCPFRITSYDLEIGETDSTQEYGVQLHDPRLLEYVGAPESARLLSRDPEYWVEHMGRKKTLSAALQLQHDAGLILSNVQILQQLVTALHGASANVMGAIRGDAENASECGT